MASIKTELRLHQEIKATNLLMPNAGNPRKKSPNVSNSMYLEKPNTDSMLSRAVRKELTISQAIESPRGGASPRLRHLKSPLLQAPPPVAKDLRKIDKIVFNQDRVSKTMSY